MNSDPKTLLQGVLACLRAQYLHYQTAHWTVVGDAAYGNHLLFQRIYEATLPEIDQLAEKMVAMHGNDSVDCCLITRMSLSILESWKDIDCLHVRSLKAEADLQECLRHVVDTMREQGTLSLGLDDFLLAVSSQHETHQYLVKQVLRTANLKLSWDEMPMRGSWAGATFRKEMT